jgi:hypothetical protein
MWRLAESDVARRFRNGSLTIFRHHRAMKKAPDDLKIVIDTLRGRPSLLAAYLDAAHKVDWQAARKPLPIGKLAAVTNSPPTAGRISAA